MMIPFSNDENLEALNVLIRNERQGLARLKYQIMVHRIVLQTPAPEVDKMDANAIKTAEVIEFLEAERGKLAPSA